MPPVGERNPPREWDGTRLISGGGLKLSAMLDRSLRLAVRNYSTLFLFVIVLVLPLHLAYTYAYRDVFSVTELHPQIENLTGGRKVHGVGPDELRAARLTFLGLSVVELALVPLLARGARAALATDAAGGVSTATGAWRGVFRPPGKRAENERPAQRGEGSPLGTVLGALLLAGAVGLLVERIGTLLTEPLADERLWVAIGVLEAVARAAGAPWLLVALALASERRSQADPSARERAAADNR